MTHGDGWVERRTDGQRKWDQEGAAASKAPTLSSLVSGGKGGMTTIRASQGGARWITALWGGGSPINSMDSQYRWCLMLQAAVATNSFWTSWPWFPNKPGVARRGKLPCPRSLPGCTRRVASLGWRHLGPGSG